MPVYKDEQRGTWWFVVRAGGKQVKRRGFPTRAAATRAEGEAQDTYGEVEQAVDGSVEAELTAWLDGRVDLKPSTLGNYRRAFKLYVFPHLGTRQLTSVKASHIHDLYGRLADTGGSGGKPLGARSVLGVHEKLTKAFKDLGLNLKINRPRTVRKKGRYKPWSVDEVKAFLSATRGSTLYPMWLTVALMGLRRGELCGLRWNDVDLDAGTMTINNQRTSTDFGVREYDPKTSASDAPLPIPGPVLSALSALPRGCDYVFANDRKANGASVKVWHPYNPDAITRAFKRACVDSGVRPIALHDVRHSCASLLNALGVSAVVIQAIVRHSDVSTTLRYYVHDNPELVKAALDQLAGHLFTDAA